uniref:Heat shock protein 70 n=1 Tax=Meloidogyne javanica TaxID=6303 RepID=A0A915LLG3_MELJA
MRKLRPTFNNFCVKKLELRGPVIGINFGFTNSSVAILEERKAKVLKNDEGSFTTPSVVSFTKNGGGECLVGAPALRQAVLNSQNTVFNVKRLIGRKFDDKEVQDFIVAVCNLNGGSFEYSVLELKNYVYEIESNKYDTCLSGEAFNNAIVNYFVSEFKRENGIDLNKDSIAIQRLCKAAEKAKCKLFNFTQTEIILPNIIADINGELKHFQITLTRSKFEELTSELTKRIVEICHPTKDKPELKIQQSPLNNENVSQNREDLPSTGFDNILLVGGMTRMPKIRNIVEEVFKKKIFNSEHEEGALAIGAVYLGVLFGNINYFDNRRTSKNKIIKMASQKMFIGERNYNGQDAVKLFWEAITIMVKEYYTSLHIDVRSRKAINGLGYFAVKYADRKGDRKREGLRKQKGDDDIGYGAIYQFDKIYRKGISRYYGDDHEDLCDDQFLHRLLHPFELLYEEER